MSSVYEIHAILARKRGTQIGNWDRVPIGWPYYRKVVQESALTSSDATTSLDDAIRVAKIASIREDKTLSDSLHSEFPEAYFQLVDPATPDLIAKSEARAIEVESEGWQRYTPDALDAWKVRRDWMAAMPEYRTSRSRAEDLTDPDKNGSLDRADYHFEDRDCILRVEVVNITTGEVVWATGPEAPDGGSVEKIVDDSGMDMGFVPAYSRCQRILTLEDVGRIPEWTEEGNKKARAEHWEIGEQCDGETESSHTCGGSGEYCSEHARAYGNNHDRLPHGVWRMVEESLETAA